MNSPSQLQLILDYINEHPGKYMSEIKRDTGQPKYSVTSALSILTKKGLLRRKGIPRRYRYYAIEPEIKPVQAKKKYLTYEDHDRINPLSNLFNERLKAVRSGRASA